MEPTKPMTLEECLTLMRQMPNVPTVEESEELVRTVYRSAVLHAAEKARPKEKLNSCGHRPTKLKEDGDADCGAENCNAAWYLKSGSQNDNGFNAAIDEYYSNLLKLAGE